MTTAPAPLADLDTEALRAAHAEFARAYDDLKARGLALDITRGKPSAEQLDLSDDLLHLPDGAFRDAAGTDLRNYGGPNGLPELRAIFADALRVPPAQLLALGNSSLTIMHDTVAQALIHGVPGGEHAGGRQPDTCVAGVEG